MDSETEIDDFSKEKNQEKNKLTSCFKVRHLIIALLFLATSVGYASRVVLSVTIVAMLNSNTSHGFPSFDWDKQGVEGFVQTSFFWGYCIGQIPSALIVQMCGCKWPLLASMLISSLCVSLTPVAAIYGGWIAMCSIRVLQGLTQASLYPGVHAALGIWTPLEERGRLANIVLLGAQIGTIVAFPVGGFLIPSEGGWPSVYYVFGGVGIVWSIFWYFFGASSPSLHPFISKEERNLIELSISNKFQTKLKTPWKALFTSAPMWALIITHCAENFGFWMLMTETPTYLDSVLEFKIQDNGLLSALPFLMMAILSYVFGWIVDFIFKRNWVSVLTSRKIFNTLGFWIPAAALVALGYMTKEQQSLAVALLVLAVGFNAGNYTGFSLGYMDLAPNFASIMMGITNCAANIFSILGTLLADEIIRDDKKSPEKWQIVFSLSAAMFFVGNLVFLVIGKADRQPWNEPGYKKEKNKQKS